MSNGNNGEDDDADDESGEGKFEYVTANERGFSQVSYVNPVSHMVLV